MQLKDSERLIVFMLAEIMDAMKLNNQVDPVLIRDLVSGADDWAIKRQYSGLFPTQSRSADVVSDTINILWMWGIIEDGIAQLQGAQAVAAANWQYKSFTGFDGNNDEHYGVAVTLIQKLGDFGSFKSRGLNSHTQSTLPRYLSMYQKFEGYVSAGQASPLNFTALQDLCN